MKPLDARLLRHARAARVFIVATAALGIVRAALVLAQAILIAQCVGRAAAEGLHDAAPRLLAIGCVALARGAVTAAQERVSHRASAHVIADLRGQLLRHAIALGPRWLGAGRAADLATLATRGLGALDDYFAKYLPQLLLVGTLTPGLLAVVAVMDWPTALFLLVTLPLIPLFMVLIGKLTASHAERRLGAMTTLGSRVEDLLAGLPTLKALGREAGPAARVRELSDAHARATFATVRIAFISGAVLELVSTLSVAVVAVEVGLRLAYGKMSLVIGLAVIIMAPEVFLPLRAMGTHYHASANGLAAADKTFAVLAQTPPARGSTPAPDLSGATMSLRGITVRPEGRGRLAPHRLDLDVVPGAVTALTGPNGAGKSTAVAVLLGLVAPDEGEVTVCLAGGACSRLADLDPASWQAQFAWVPQRPVLLPGTVWENLTGDFDAPPPSPDARARADAAAHAAAFDSVLATLPRGWDTRIGHGGLGLSVGQRQRLALARAFLQDRPVVILDEPTAHLDAATEQRVLAAARTLANQGRAVLIVAHRESLLATADATIAVHFSTTADDDGPRLTAAADDGDPPLPRTSTIPAAGTVAP
ncbi:MAG: thiol reductant ABC exporter subunit CydD [Micrococcales bacterium]|nr:thiol reductant ABC exporter subunit CydD [Micrococcales bacterium]